MDNAPFSAAITPTLQTSLAVFQGALFSQIVLPEGTQTVPPKTSLPSSLVETHSTLSAHREVWPVLAGWWRTSSPYSYGPV